MTDLRVTELDFEAIKTNLKNFMRAQSEFSDYDFDGSALNALLDVLAYNTHYNAMLAHLMSNEMFIDTAIKRSSVVSIAKTMGYIPRSYSAARATISLTVPTDSPLPMTVDTSTKFTTTKNGTPYTFNVEESATVTPEAISGGYQAVFPEVLLVEGTRLQNAFTVTADNRQGPFVIPVENIDLSTIRVVVKTSANVEEYTVFTRSLTVVDVSDTSTVFWVEENADGKFQLIFGDDVIGATLDVGNIVTVYYVACNGSTPNGVRTFTLSGTVGGTSNVTITTVDVAGAGAEKETIDSIRFNAPKFNNTRNRAVTAQDYKSLILADSNINFKANSISVWGGEENIPPVYGKVFITIDPTDSYLITDSDKKYIIDRILRPRSVMSIQHEFVDPEFIYLGFDVVISYNENITNLSSTELTALAHDRITEFFSENLSTLDRTFFFSQLVDAITTINPAILGVLVNMRIQNRITKLASFNTTKNLRFLASLEPDSISSTVFVSLVNGISYNAYIKDFHDGVIKDPTGTGTLKLLEADTNTVLVSALGTVDYKTGILSFSDLNISSYLGNITDVRINAVPQSLSKNISPSVISATEQSTSAVFPAPAKNIIIELDDSEINTAIKLNPGLNITTIPFSEL